MDDVFLELAQRWSSLSRNQQRYIATTAAGSRQQSRFIALMSDYERTMELVNTAYDSQGRSSQQFAKYADSVEYSLKKLSNTWEQFRVNLANNDFYKGLIDTANNLLEKISNFDALDWGKLLLVFSTVGYKSVQSFLTGAQKAISETSGTIKSTYGKIPNNIQDMDFFQKRLTGYSQKRFQKISAQQIKNYNAEQEKYTRLIQEQETALAKLNTQKDTHSKWFTATAGTMSPQEAAAANQQLKEYNSQIEKSTEELNRLKSERNGITEPQSLEEIAKDPKNLLNPQLQMAKWQAAGTAAGSAFTAAFTTSMMTDDLGTIFTTTFFAGATAAIPGAINTFNTALKANTDETGQLVAGGLSASIKEGVKGGLIALGISLAIAALAIGIEAASQAWDKHNEKVLEADSAYYATSKRIAALKEEEKLLGEDSYKAAAQAEKTGKAYNELANKTKELEELRNKILLTSEESQQLVDVSNEIAKIAPELVSSYDSEGNAIIALADSYQNLLDVKREIALQDQLVADEAAQKLAKNTLKQAFENRQLAEDAYNAAQTEEIAQYFKNYTKGNQLFTDKNWFARSVGAFLESENPLGVFGIEDPYTKRSLTKYEQENYGRLAKEWFKNISGLESLQGVNDFEAITELNELLDDMGEMERAETVKKMNEAMQSLTENYTRLDYEIQASINNYISSSKNLAATQLGLGSKTYQDQTDRNVQEFMQAYVLGQNGLTADKLKESFEKSSGLKEGDKEYFKQYEEFVIDAFKNIEIDESKISKIFTDETISVISQIGSLNLELPALAEYLSKAIPELFEIWVEQNKAQIEAHNKNIKDINRIVGGKLSEGPGGIKTSSNPLVNAIMGARNAGDFAAKANAWSNAGRKNDFLNIISGWSGEDLAKVFEIKWSDVAAIEYTEQLEALSKLVKGKGKKDIEQLISSLNLFDYVPASEDAFKEQLDDRFKYLDKYDKKIKAIQSAGDSWAKDGKVSASAIESLYDAGIKVSDLVDNNLQFNLEAAKELIVQELQGELDSLELEKAKTQEYVKQLKLLQLMVGSTYSSADLKNIDPDMIERFFINKNGKYTINSVALNAAIGEANNLINNWDGDIATLKIRIETLFTEIDSAYKGIANTAEDSAKKRVDAEKAVKEAYENVLEKQQDVIDKQKELNKVLYGDEYHKNKLDGLYNYNTALDVFNEQIQDAKNSLDDLKGQSPIEFFDAWLNGTHGKAVNLQATNDRYNAAINSIQSMLNGRLVNYLQGLGRGVSTNVADYYRYNEGLDRYEINYNQLNLAQMNDQLKDFIEEQVDLMNQHKKSIKKNQDELKNLEKEFQEYQKKLRDDYISVQESIAKTLEEYYKKEVEDKKEMYEALEEADNKYLDALQKAIDRERKLRDTQDKWNDLATKEKRLSLLQRDTSGANTKTVQSLRKEIEKDRRSMLDSAVDTVVENLKELYETQKETREIELQYQEALLENSNYIAEANQLLESWKTVDEMRDWMWAHTEDINKMSDQAVEKLTEDWVDMFDTVQAYNEATQRDITSIFNVAAAEVQNVVFTTSEVLTSEAARAFGEVSTSVNDAIANAEKAVSDAIDALADAQQNYNEKLAEFNQLVSEFINQASLSPSQPTYEEENHIQEQYGELDLTHYYPEVYQDMAKYGYHIFDKDLNKLAYYKSLEIDGKPQYLTAYDDNYGYIFKDDDAYYDYIKQDPMHRSTIKKYKIGGLASYTGPAWVDGTPSRPEAFLSAEDTARIGEAANIFASLASLGTNGTLGSGLSQTIGDTNTSINIYVESIATPDQVDYLINRMKEEIVDTANPIGTSVILHQ